MIFLDAKVIFVPIPKTGTTTIVTDLRNNGFVPKTFPGDTNHLTMVQCHERIISLGLEPSDFKSFSFIRNPWSHMYSLFAYTKKVGKYSGTWDEFMWNIQFTYEQMDFWKEHQLKGYFNRIYSPWGKVDFIGKLENIHDDWNFIKNKLFANKWFLDKAIPHLQKSAQHNEYLSVYKPHQIEVIGEIYKKEIQDFGYTFWK